MTTLGESLKVIRKYWDTAPVPVDGILTELGLGPVYRSYPNAISGKIVRSDTPAGYTIIINDRQHLNRRRFTMAHELGHYLYHRDLLQLGVGDTLAYRAEGSGTPNDKIGPQQETEANRFAANLLMPSHLIASLRAEGVTKPLVLAERLGVSEAAIRIRLGLTADRGLFEEDEAEDAEEDQGVGFL